MGRSIGSHSVLIRNRWGVSVFLHLAVVCAILAIGQPVCAAAPVSGAANIERGAEIFGKHCIACHSIGEGDRTGPDLAGLDQRPHDRAWYVNYVMDPAPLRETDEYARELYETYNPQGGEGMKPFATVLSAEEVGAALDYVYASGSDAATKNAANPLLVATPESAPAPASGAEEKFPIGIVVLLVCLGGALFFAAGMSKGKLPKGPGTVMAVYLACMAPVGLFVDFGAMRFPGNHQGYAPEQPIPFSHELHAGGLNIPCQYCHSGVMESRHASIPSISTCMNCHQQLVKGVQNSTTAKNIAKVVQYYDDGQPIRWVRVHRLPDFVRFNHSAHTTKGIDCTECHGDVATMAVLRHDKEHSMGFCLDCHRQKNAESQKPDSGKDFRAPTDSCGACHH